MKTFKEWLWNREKSQEPQYKDYSAYAAAQRDKEKKQQNKKTGFFSNLFDKKPTPAPTPVPKKKGNIDDIKRLFDPNYDPSRPAPAENQAEKNPQIQQPSPKQVQLSSSPKNPEEYVEEVFNKYRDIFLGDFLNIWKERKKGNEEINLYTIYQHVALSSAPMESWSRPPGSPIEELPQRPIDNVPKDIIEKTKNALVKMIENLGYRSFPDNDVIKIGHEHDQLNPDEARTSDFKPLSYRRSYRVLMKGFKKRHKVWYEAIVF